MDLTYYVSTTKKNINRQNYEFCYIKNITTLPKNLFNGFPPVYLITFTNTSKSIESRVNIRLTIPMQELKTADLIYLSEYENLCCQYNTFIDHKKNLRDALRIAEAHYKYQKYIIKNQNTIREYQEIYQNHKMKYAKHLHFDRVKLVLIDDLYQHFLSKI